ncbi:MAG: glycosyltransferase family 2 protein [Rhizomicrobium sp.]
MQDEARIDAHCRDAALPRISVVTPSFNHAQFLAAAMDSVLSQNYPGLEYIVMDGGSKDGSADIIRARAGKLAYWQSEPDGGQASALNAGLARATGDIIGWLNSDDLYSVGTLEKVGRYFAEHPDTMLLYGDCLTINEYDRVLNVIRPGAYDNGRMAYRCFTMQMATFFRRDLLEKIGPFDLNFRYAMDHDLWLRAGTAFPDAIAYLPETLACYSMHEQSQSVRDVLPALFDAINVRRKLAAVRPRPVWLEKISGDIFRQPLILLLGAATDEANLPIALARLREMLGDALTAEEWAHLGRFLASGRVDRATGRAGPDLLSRIERQWIIACGGIETLGHRAWLANALVELGWRHLRAGHVGRGLSMFGRAVARRPACLAAILRWRLVEMLVRAQIGQGTFLFLREIKRRAMGFFLPSLPS